MIKDIVKYPQTPSIEFNANVRKFDDELFSLIDDVKDTLIENNLEALSAYQIRSPYSVIVLKNSDGTFTELINATIVSRSEKITSQERTAYFPDMSAKITRDKNITVMYQDRDAATHYLKASDELSILLQRKIDYNFGSNFRERLSKEDKEKFDMKLSYGVDVITDNSCPTDFNRDKILKVINILLAVSLLGIISSFFLADETLASIYMYENYLLSSVAGLIVVYFFYAQYEGKKYTNCMSCQLGNIIGVALLHVVKTAVLFGTNYFLVQP